MKDAKGPVGFRIVGDPLPAVFTVQPEAVPIVRYSNALRNLRRHATPDRVAAFEADYEKFGSQCGTHGRIPDPIVGILVTTDGARVAFACPHCSGPEVLAAWENEPPHVDGGDA